MASRRNGRATAVATIAAPIKCAIYVRKSTDEGLDQAFNSLHNQRDAALSYIASQRHENWTALAEEYADGGFSGGNTERPALKKLLADVEAGRLEIIVVYKLDRLSRSLLDFLTLHRFLEAHGVQIVSVTEPIDTRTPIGRAFVNILVSFGQMEREVAGERTAHKIRAARQRGHWTGGMPPLGFDTVPEGGRIVVNKSEAEQVRAIFDLYLANPSLVGLAQELNRRGWRKKSWTTREGKARQGARWDRVSLARMLKDPVYAGKQKLGDELFAGKHDAIVPKALFERVQKQMNGNRTTRGAAARNRHGFLLRGLLRCAACDRAMVPHAAKAHSRLYRYYTCTTAQKQGHATCPTKSVHADRVELFVVGEIKRIGADPELQNETFKQATLQVKARRRGLRLESKRLADEIARARTEVDRFVGAVTHLHGTARDAVAAELAKAQEHFGTLEARQAEVAAEMESVKAQDVDWEAVARALEQFDELWSVLLTAERERVLRLLIERVDYHGGSGKLEITWSWPGFGQLAAEVAP